MDILLENFEIDDESITLLLAGDYSETKGIKFVLDDKAILSEVNGSLSFVDGKTTVIFPVPSETICEIYFSQSTDPIIHENDILVLNNLFARNDSDYSKMFRSRPLRPEITSLNFFVARQIAMKFRGSYCYRIGAAVVEAYKTVEMLNLTAISASDNRLQELYPLVELCEYASSPRVNKEHLRCSMLCTHFHLKIMLGDYSGMMDVLQKTKDGIRGVAIFYTPSYPINLSLLLLALTAKLKNDEEMFNEVLGRMEFVYRRAVLDSSIENSRWFKELGVSHNAVVHALQLREEYLNKDTSIELIKTVFFRSIRVKGKSAYYMFKKYMSFFSDEQSGENR